jgi:hypothetical protein
MSIADKLKDFPKIDVVKFSIFCARQVIHLSVQPIAKETLNLCEAWVEDPSEENTLKVKKGSRDCWSCSHDMDIYNDVVRVVANVADGIYDGERYTSDWAHWAAHWAISTNPELTEEGLFQSWLISQVIEDNYGDIDG